MDIKSYLEELYAERKVFLKRNRPIPQDLIDDINNAETKILKSSADIVLDCLPLTIKCNNCPKFIIGIQYENGALTKTALALNSDLKDKFDNVINVTADNENDFDDDLNDDIHRSKSVGFSVKFSDGKFIKRATALNTMIEALRYMGLERASKFKEDSFSGFPLIGKNPRVPDTSKWQKYVDGWWIYKNMSNKRKILCLKGVAKFLDISLKIIPDTDAQLPFNSSNQTDKNRKMFSLDGSVPMCKNRAVLFTVSRVLQEMPIDSFDDIESLFPGELQGSYGVIRTLADINQRKERNKSETSRWFIDPSEILKTPDGTPFCVCSEWGNNFASFQNHVIKEFGWSLEEV